MLSLKFDVEVKLIGIREEFKEIYACGIVADVFGVVKFMIAGAIHERDHSGRRPREIITTMRLAGEEKLEDNPNE